MPYQALPPSSVPVNVSGTVDVDSILSPVTSMPVQNNSLESYGSAVGLLADTAFVSITPPAGYYDINARVRTDGTLTAVDLSNIVMKAGADELWRFNISEVGGPTLYTTTSNVRRNLDGLTTVSLRSVGAASPLAL